MIEQWLQRGWFNYQYQADSLCCEQVPISEITRQVGTPCYVYSRSAIERAFDSYREGFGDQPHLIAYATKANENLAITRLLAQRGAGADIVSGGQLYKALQAGIPADRIVYSGVAKTADEIRMAVEAGILFFNVESGEELDAINTIAQSVGKTAGIAVRVNPDVDPQTHPYISTGMKEHKFGVEIPVALELYRRAAASPHLEVRGLQCHIGSQITSTDPHREALARLLKVRQQLAAEGIATPYVDLGGGLGICYQDETPPTPADFVRGLREVAGDCDATLIVEPGRSLVGNSGALITQVLYRKDHGGKHYTIIDAGMNDLMRPAMYQAFHPILPVNRTGAAIRSTEVVGPICESTDQFAWDRPLPEMQIGEHLAVLSAGAYGSAMSSLYNAHPFCPEVLVEGNQWSQIRRRQKIEELLVLENR